MKQEEQVLIRGKCFLYRQKAPFVPSGKSVHGALEYREATDEVRCHECGLWYRHLATHALRAHDLRASDYRSKHGLRSRCALCGPRLLIYRAGQEERYQHMRAVCRTPEWRAKFGALARDIAAKRRAAGVKNDRRTDLHERLNETGHCRAQLTQRLKELSARYGGIPTNAELIENGISPSSVCLAFNLPTISEVLTLLKMVPTSKRAGYTREVLVEILRDFWARYHRLPGRAHERMGLVPRWDVFKRKFGGMAAAYKAAGLSKEAARSPYNREILIRQLREFYRKHGDVPKASRKYGSGHGDALPPGFPTRNVFRRVFGSLDAAYEAAGLPA